MVKKKLSNSADVIAAIEEYLKQHGETATGFGLRFNGDPNLVHNLRKGRGPRMTTIDRLIPFLDKPPPHVRQRSQAKELVDPDKLQELLERSEQLSRLLRT